MIKINFETSERKLYVRFDQLERPVFDQILAKFRELLPNARWDENVKKWVLPIEYSKAVLDFAYSEFPPSNIQMKIGERQRVLQPYLF